MKALICKEKVARLAAILAISAPILLATGLISPAHAEAPVRITTSFDHRHCAAVLRQVAKTVSGGFDHSTAEKLASEIDGLPADKRRSWDFTVSYKGGTHALHVQALVDDLGMIDLDFSTDEVLAPALRSAVDTYLNSHG